MNFGGDEVGWGELHAAPVHPAAEEQITSLECDAAHEIFWAGTDSGGLYALHSPTLKRFSCVRAHDGRIDDLLPATGGGALSLSASHLKLHSVGGLVRASIPAAQDAPMLACAMEPGKLHHAIVSRQGASLGVFDLATTRLVSQASLEAEAIILRAPSARGLVAAGMEDGTFVLLDPRTGYKVQHSAATHAAGLAMMDAKADLVATAGYGMRQGRVIAETHVKVYDVRMTPRMLTLLPFNAGPAMLRFHPSFSATLLLASASGIFTLADAQGSSQYAPTYQVDLAGDTMVAASMASTGETLGFGGSGGYVHLWALSNQPSINAYSQPLETPVALPTPSVQLTERDTFSDAETYFSEQGQLLSDFDPDMQIQVGAAPRVVDPALLANSKRADFVTYIPNPHFRKGTPRGQAARGVAKVRNMRLKLAAERPDSAAARAERRTARAAAGDVLLPPPYQYTRIKQQAGTRFEAFDFSAHNRTRFGGLENDLANCYTNPLWQVLYFVPAFREAMLRHAVEADKEFCLSCELGFLFRMLYAAKGQACQASNLLRALRQNREAGALGLLEGHAQRSSGTGAVADALVEASRDASLRRRLQSLQRFLLQQLHREAAPPAPAAEAAGAAANLEAHAAERERTAVDQLFGMAVRQRTVCMSGVRAERTQETRSFQVELQQPGAGADVRSTPASPVRPGSAAPGSHPASPARGAAAKEERPAFAQLLADSLRAESTQRGWFDDERRYQMLQQSRVPLSLPQVMVVSCGMPTGGALWWQAPPHAAAVPWALAVSTHPDTYQVEVKEGDSAEELQTSLSGPADGQRAVYELTAVVAHVRDLDEPPGDPATADGHLLAHIRVPQGYLDTDHGIAPSPAPPSPGQSPWPRGGAFGGGRAASLASAPPAPDAAPEPQQPERSASGSEPQRTSSAPAAAADVQPEAAGDVASDAADEPDGESAPSTPQQQVQWHSSMTAALGGLSISTLRGNSGQAAAPPRSAPLPPPEWMLFNDFVIKSTPAAEVQATFGGQKLPCMLYYTRVDAAEAAAQEAIGPPPPVLDSDAFRRLCMAHPVQGPQAQLERPTYRVVQEGELPAPGMVFGIDAEFVALSHPDKVLQGGMDVEARAARLGLARVSVVRGQGPRALTACIDDYICTLEPVADYLTRFSGLVAGDLDPVRSRRYLTTAKRTYLKLRHLVDAGCLLVGHGLKKDFRMINIVVPAAQVVDTAELFSFKRQRKLSLRFLAAFLLRVDIQRASHDSIEDARTALALYQAYQRLAEDGPAAVRAGLTAMYDWGNSYGWEPANWPHPPPE